MKHIKSQNTGISSRSIVSKLLDFFQSRKKSASLPAISDEASFRLLADYALDVIYRVLPDGRVTYISPSVEALLGFKPEHVLGKNALLMILEEDHPLILPGIALMRSGEVNELRNQVRALRSDGTTVWVETIARILPVSDRSAVLIMRDITDQKRLEEKLGQQALQDGLTGLSNRRAFDQTLDCEWDRTLREGTEMTLLLIDVDYFKQFNDGYGHQVGDDCLRSVAAAIQTHVQRPGDLVCRYGGEEIAVILGHTGAVGGLELAELLRASVEALAIPHIRNPNGSVVTVSIGVATALAREGGTIRMPEGLLQSSDHALYRAKNDGRNRVSQSILLASGRELVDWAPVD